MNQTRQTRKCHHILEPMIALARCSKLQRIIVAGEKSIELTMELERRGYRHVAASANCSRPAEQYDVALVDWRRRTFRALDATLDWLVGFLRPEGGLVAWTDPQKEVAREALSAALERRGFVIETTAVHADGYAVSAQRRDFAGSLAVGTAMIRIFSGLRNGQNRWQ